MHVGCQFYIVAIIYSCYSFIVTESANCDCDVLEVKSNCVIGNQNFTKQSGTLYDKPFYFSMEKCVIYWFEDHWSYAVHIDSNIRFRQKQEYEMKIFSIANICKNRTWTSSPKDLANTFLNTRCLRDNNICSVPRELAINVTIDFKQIELKVRDCPMEDTIIKANDAVKSWHIELVIGILVRFGN